MDEKSLFLKFWNKEADATRKVISRVPEGSDYRPDPKSRTARELAWLMAREEAVLADGLGKGALEWTEDPPPATIKEILKNVKYIGVFTMTATWVDGGYLLGTAEGTWKSSLASGLQGGLCYGVSLILGGLFGSLLGLGGGLIVVPVLTLGLPISSIITMKRKRTMIAPAYISTSSAATRGAPIPTWPRRCWRSARRWSCTIAGRKRCDSTCAPNASSRRTRRAATNSWSS